VQVGRKSSSCLIRAFCAFWWSAKFHFGGSFREKVGIGIIGCGNISGPYLTAMRSFPILDIRGVADLNRERAEARAAEFKLKA
jgi:hypothetical protein